MKAGVDVDVKCKMKRIYISLPYIKFATVI